MIQKTSITSTYNARDELTQQVSTAHGTTINVYDPNGSLTSGVNGGQITTYSFDVRNRMSNYASGATSASYIYNDAGQRVKETNGSTTLYLTDRANPTGYAQPIEERWTANGSPTMTYLIGDHVIGQIAGAAANPTYLLAEGHGSTRALTDNAGAVVSAFNYDAFGGALGTGFTLATAGTPFLFGGDAVYDKASGLYLHGDGIRGRLASTDGFVESDVIGYGSKADPITLHKYLYANGNPTNTWDSSGHEGLAELLVSNGVSTLLQSFSMPVLRSAGNCIGSSFIPTWISDAKAPNVAMIGAGVSYGRDVGKGLGITGEVAIETVVSLHNGNAGLFLGWNARVNAAEGAHTALPVFFGLGWGVKDSESYAEVKQAITLPFAAIPKRLQEAAAKGFLASLPMFNPSNPRIGELLKAVGGGYDQSQLASAIQSVSSLAKNIIARTEVTAVFNSEELELFFSYDAQQFHIHGEQPSIGVGIAGAQQLSPEGNVMFE